MCSYNYVRWIKVSRLVLQSSYVEIVKPGVLTDFEDVKKETKEAVKKEEKKAQTTPSKNNKKICASCNPKDTLNNIKNSRYFSFSFYKNNPSYLIAFGVYIALSIFFIIIQVTLIHPNVPWYTTIARAAGILIYFNSDLIVVCVLRRIVTWFRNTRIGKMMNFIDEFVEFHKAMGILIFILSFIHTLGQCINLCKFIIHSFKIQRDKPFKFYCDKTKAKLKKIFCCSKFVVGVFFFNLKKRIVRLNYEVKILR